MSVKADVAALTERMESDDSVTRQDVYTMLLRAFLEIQQLENRVRVLEEYVLPPK